MFMNSMPEKTVIYVKTTRGTFGPYPSRTFAEQMLMSGQIPKESNEMPQIVEKFEDGREILFG